jgi:hypothetical protein
MRLLKTLTALGIMLFVAAHHTSFAARGGHQIHGSWQVLSSHQAALNAPPVRSFSSASHEPSHNVQSQHSPTLTATAAKKTSQFDTLLKNNAFSKRNLAGTLAGRSGSGRRSNSGPQCGCAQNRANAQRLAQSGSGKGQMPASTAGQRGSASTKSPSRSRALAARGSLHPSGLAARTPPHNQPGTMQRNPRTVQPMTPPHQMPSPPPSPQQMSALHHRPATKR